MDQQEHHQMVLETTHPSGAEEWYCPTCGRRFLLRWPPSYEKIVLDPGDQDAAHSGSKGPMLSMDSLTVVGSQELAPTDELFSHQQALPSETAILNDGDEVGKTPITDELRPWLKWLQGDGRDQEQA
jgi:hypothetical protein